MKAWLAIRSTLFYAGYWVFITVFTLLSCTFGLLLSVPARQTLATTGNWLIVRWLSICCGIRVVVKGAENIPEQPVVVLSNHQSPWETFYLQRRLRPVSTILKKELLRIPIFGWGLASVKPIAIDRSNPRQAIKQVLSQGQERLQEGMNVIVYPEGTRMNYGEYGSYARSGASLAEAAGASILPVAHNAGRCWPSRRFIKFPGTITIVFGPLLSAENLNSKVLTQQAEQWIKTTQQGME